MRKLITTLALVCVLPFTSPAGIPVIDYSNLIQTTTTALKQVAAYAQQVQQYQLQIQQYKNQILQATGIASVAQIWQSAQGTMNQIKGVTNMFTNGGGLQGYLQNAKDINYWLSAPAGQYTYQPASYWSTTQKTANDQLVQEISQQEQRLQVDAQTLDRLQSQAGSTVGQKAALDVANEMSGLQQKQLMEIRTLLLSEQQALAARSGNVANNEAMTQAQTQTYYGTVLAPMNHTGW
jgi:type IV secretion system protein TrbJ